MEFLHFFSEHALILFLLYSVTYDFLSVLLLPSLLFLNLSMPPKPRRRPRTFPSICSLTLYLLLKHRLLSFPPHQRFPTHSHPKLHSSLQILLPHVSRRRDGSSHPLLCWSESIELVRIFKVWERIARWARSREWRGSGEERGCWRGEEERSVRRKESWRDDLVEEFGVAGGELFFLLLTPSQIIQYLPRPFFLGQVRDHLGHRTFLPPSCRTKRVSSLATLLADFLFVFSSFRSFTILKACVLPL